MIVLLNFSLGLVVGVFGALLARAGATELGTIAVVSPLRGTNVAGDPFMTDGRAVILATPQR